MEKIDDINNRNINIAIIGAMGNIGTVLSIFFINYLALKAETKNDIKLTGYYCNDKAYLIEKLPGLQLSLVSRNYNKHQIKDLVLEDNLGNTIIHSSKQDILNLIQLDQLYFTDDIESLPPQDYIFCAIKQYDISLDLIKSIKKILKPNNVGKVIFIHNGMQCAWPNVLSVDPENFFKKLIGLENIIASVNYIAANPVKTESEKSVKKLSLPLAQTEVILGHVIGSNKLTKAIGEISLILRNITNIRITNALGRKMIIETLKKQQINIAFNSLSAITGNTFKQIIDDEIYKKLFFLITDEIYRAVLILKLGQLYSIEEMTNIVKKFSDHKASMCIDIENGRKIENLAIIDSFIEFIEKKSRAVDINEPNLKYTKEIAKILTNLSKEVERINNSLDFRVRLKMIRENFNKDLQILAQDSCELLYVESSIKNKL